MTHKSFIPFFLIAAMIFIVYSNTFSAPWQFDDLPNILDNKSTHLSELSWENIHKSFSLDENDRLSRAIPRFSLALNWYFGKNNVFGYHLVNTIVHCLSAYFLFLLIFHMIDILDPFNKNKYGIALLSAILWAVHPIQIQAVTYIIQRMASMAAMFSILSMLFYVLGRKVLCAKKGSGCIYFILSALFFICALFSKQNAAMLPGSVLLMEVVLFKNNWIQHNKYKLCQILFLLSALLLLFLLGFHADWVFHLFSYENRPFTCVQRCLTEFRVLVFYLSLIVFPITWRFSIEHYFHPSTSLVEPLSTLLSLGIIVSLLVLAFFSRKKHPFLSFALFFYFLNHIIESSFIGLELAFEHRNYLPSLFLFVPLSLLLDTAMVKKKRIKPFLLFSLCLLIIVLGASTYNRNKVWKTFGGIWEDALAKSPESGRVLFNYASRNLYAAGKDKAALNCFLASANMGWHRTSSTSEIPMSGIIPLLKRNGQNKLALDYARKAVVANPRNTSFLQELFLLQVKSQLWHAADFTSDVLLRFDEQNPAFLNFKGLILLKKEKPVKALYFLRKNLMGNPLNMDALIYTGYALNKMGLFKQAEKVLNIAKAYYPNNPDILFQLLNNSLDQKSCRTEFYSKSILAEQTFVQIVTVLKKRNNDPMALRLNCDVMADAIANTLRGL